MNKKCSAKACKYTGVCPVYTVMEKKDAIVGNLLKYGFFGLCFLGSLGMGLTSVCAAYDGDYAHSLSFGTLSVAYGAIGGVTAWEEWKSAKFFKEL